MIKGLGETEAERVYPQMNGRVIPGLNEEVTMQIERISMKLITVKGWTTESEILQQLTLQFPGQKQFKQRQFKRMLPEMLDNIACNKLA